MQNMPHQLAEELDALIQELYWINLKYAEYEMAYGRDVSRINFLNSVAPRFFGVVERVMWADILVHLTKLAAPGKTGKNDNLTVQRLPKLVDPQVKDSVSKAVKAAVDAVKFAEAPRNKIFAHLDLNTSLQAVNTISLGSRAEVRHALTALLGAINSVSMNYGEGTEHIIDFTHGDGTAEELIEILQIGLSRSRLEPGGEGASISVHQGPFVG